MMAGLLPSVPSEPFYAVHDWDRPVMKKAQGQSQDLVWDLWPVNHTVNKDVFSAG